MVYEWKRSQDNYIASVTLTTIDFCTNTIGQFKFENKFCSDAIGQFKFKNYLCSEKTVWFKFENKFFSDTISQLKFKNKFHLYICKFNPKRLASLRLILTMISVSKTLKFLFFSFDHLIFCINKTKFCSDIINYFEFKTKKFCKDTIGQLKF